MLMSHSRILIALLFAFAALSMSLSTSLPAAEEAEGTREYVVKDTDTLSSIALRELGDPRRVNEIMALNPEITDPNRIYEQQRVRLPDEPPPGQLSWSYTWMEDAGLLGVGALASVGVILVVYLGVMAGGHLLIGGLLLWLGALLAGVSGLGFWKSFGANFKATLLSILVALALWSGGVIAYSFVSHENLAGLRFDDVWPWALAIAAGITAIQFMVYVNSVRGSLSIGFFRAIGACLMAAVLEGVFVVFLTPTLAVFA